MAASHVFLCAFTVSFFLTFSQSWAGEAEIVDVNIILTDPQTRTYRFDVTVRHDDTGWDHYANRWEIVAPDGTILGTRTLLHPHETEQPFTRSLSGVVIPAGIETVTVRAYDNVHGLSDLTQTIAVKPSM